MKTNLANLSRTYLAHLNEKGRISSEPCVDTSDLARCAMGELPRREREGVIDHAANCAGCAATLKQILDLSSQTGRAANDLAMIEARRTPRSSRHVEVSRKRLVYWPAAAVSLGLLLFAALVVFAPIIRNLTGTRGGTGAAIVLSYPKNGTDMPKAGLVFKWEGLSGARSYRVELFDRAFQLLWRSGDLNQTEMRLPDEIGRKLVPGEKYYWMVTALTENRRESKSRLVEFSVGRQVP